jgi:hypothetical protein
MIQIFMWTLQYCLTPSTACMIFRALENICDLFVVDLEIYLIKSKSGVCVMKMFESNFQRCTIVFFKLQELDFLF